MRIALITYSLLPSPTGLARAAHEIASALVEAGCEVVVFTADRHSQLRTGPGYSVVGVKPSWRLYTLIERLPVVAELAIAIVFRLAVAREHSRKPFDIIEGHNWKFPGLLLSLWPLVPFVTRNSTSISAMTSHSAKSNLATFIESVGIGLLFTLEKLSARSSSAMISNSYAHKETIERLYKIRPCKQRFHSVSYLSLNHDFLRRVYEDISCSAAPTLSLLFVGRATSRKGFDTLLDAYQILEKAVADGQVPNFILSLVGIEALHMSSPRLRPLGKVDEETLHRLYEQCDMLIAPSRYESFGLIYLEAMAYGKPIVACAEAGAAKELVGKAEAGVVIDQCVGSELARGIIQLLLSAELRYTLGRNGKLAAAQFTRSALAQRTIAAYNNVVRS